MTDSPQATPPARAPTRTAVVVLIVAISLFMQNLDGTVLSTAIPTMAREFRVNPLDLKLALTAYLLALAIFIPASGWVADRYGARNVFCWAMVVFAMGSIACALSQNVPQIVAARVFQGIGGAMMVPVGRIVVLRVVPRAEFVGAMALLSIPALLGPISGPPLGGFITTYASWQWIFWINVPFAIVGILLALSLIPDIRASEQARFDFLGFALIGPGLSMVLAGVSLLGVEGVGGWWVYLVMIAGGGLIIAYIRYALARPGALIDLTLLKIPSFRAGIVGGFIFRVGLGASPFLLPLLLQEGLGFSAFHSGMVTFVTGLGAITMKTLAPRILRRFGFRRVLLVNAVAASLLAMLPALFIYHPPVYVMIAVLFVGGLLRSLQFTSLSIVVFSDITEEEISRASTFSATLQELSGTVGIAVAAIVLQTIQHARGASNLAASHFPMAFVLLGIIAILAIVELRRLDPKAGEAMIAGRKVSAADRGKPPA
jgi:EmrB/QacA subfamily drug resistance transporter